MRTKRCHWYNNDGEALEYSKDYYGCKNVETCTFAHPWESFWKTALPCGPDTSLTPHATKDAPRRQRSWTRSRSRLDRRSPRPRGRLSRSRERGRWNSPPRRRSHSRSVSRARHSRRRNRSRMSSARHSRSRSQQRHSDSRARAPDRVKTPASRSNSRDCSSRRGETATETRLRGDGDGRTRVTEGQSTRAAHDHRPSVLQPKSESEEEGELVEEDKLQSSPARAPSEAQPREMAPSIPTAPRALRNLLARAAKRNVPPPTTPLPAPSGLGMHLASPAPAPAPTPMQPSASPPPLPPAPPVDEKSRRSTPMSRTVKQEGDDTTTWAERVKFLSEATTARTELKQIETELHRYKALAESPHFDDLGEDAKLAVKQGLVNMKLHKIEKTKDLREAVRRLAASGQTIFSCTKEDADSPQLSATVKVDASDQRGITELKECVTQLQQAVKDMGIYNGTEEVLAPGMVPPEPSTIQHPVKVTPTNVDDADVDMADATPDVDDTKGPRSPAEQTACQDIETLTNTMEEFEERVSVLENESRQQQQELLDEAEALIQERVRELQEELEERTLPSDSDLALVNKIEEDVRTVGDDLTELAQEVAELIMQHGTLISVNDQLNRENDELRRCLAESEERFKSQLDVMQAKMSVVTDMISRLEQDPCPAQAHRLCGLSDKALAEMLRPHMETSLRQQMQPLIAEATQSMETMLKQHSDEVESNVMPKIAIAIQVTKTIESWIRNASGAANGRPAPGANCVPP